MELPFQRVGGGAGHHHFERALFVVVAVPGRTQCYQLPVQFNGDTPAHADDHSFAVHDLQPVLEMFHQIAGDKLEAVLGTNHRFELCPFSLELLLTLDFFALGCLFEFGVNLGSLGFAQFQPGQAALVVDRHRGPIRDRTLNVVNADVVAEHRPGIFIAEFQRCAGKADERDFGQRVTQMARETVDEIVLAAVQLLAMTTMLRRSESTSILPPRPLVGKGWGEGHIGENF